ncbi:hypothetical protein DKK79_07405 [Gilliamella apicola]|uniref:Uncharacterized protein n=1 Tax=Gilliamella apicola TaxID=1196095 RepID=A0A2V4E1P8_9GAMM|nr:hypothetical protein DKK79_07405 [Gilliamella apicola]
MHKGVIYETNKNQLTIDLIVENNAYRHPAYLMINVENYHFDRMKMPSTIMRNLYPPYILLAFQNVNITDLTHIII